MLFYHVILSLVFISITFSFLIPMKKLIKKMYMNNIAITDKPQLIIEKDENSVGLTLCNILEYEYKESIASKGSFCFGISGGSMLKMLSNLNGKGNIDWSKCVMTFVSHRCVPLDDDGATYHKAKPLFLQSWIDQGLQVITLTGTTDSEFESNKYEDALKLLPSNILSFNSRGYPIFDLLLIGIGIDGHIGSLYPNLSDVYSPRIILPATSKNGKITMSLSTMLSCKKAIVACAGRSSKAPLGKAFAMVKALEREDETPMTFPASKLRDKAIWLIDESSASLLKTIER